MCVLVCVYLTFIHLCVHRPVYTCMLACVRAYGAHVHMGDGCVYIVCVGCP